MAPAALPADGAPGADRHRFTVLDSWRGLAALGVALHHLYGSGPLLTGALHGELSRAVDFFFVLSGFVIAMSYGDRLAQGFSLARFLWLRWWRIWPLHAVMVLIYLALELALWWHGAGGMLTGRAAFTGPRDLVALPVSALLLQAWVWPDRDLWNVQSWSVSVELGLYLGSALLWRGCGAWANRIGLLLAVLALVIVSQGWVESDQILRGVAGFGLGMACWNAWPQVRTLPVPYWLAALLEPALVGLMLVAIAAGVPLAVADLLFAAMVLLFARAQGPISRVLLTAPFRWLGVLSYALYMVHGLVFGRVFDVLAAAQHQFGGRWVSAHLGGGDMLLLSPLGSTLAALAMLAVALAAAWLAWRFVEWPARAWSRSLAARIGPTATPAT